MDSQEFQVTEARLAGLLHRQFPHWAGQTITRLSSSGTDNLNYRVGDALVARLPRQPASVLALVKEQTWMPRLERDLPVIIPHLMACGEPSPEFPAPWSVNAWIDGEPFSEEAVVDWKTFVQGLAAFVQALQRVDTSGAPPPGPHNFGRGAPLAGRNQRVHTALNAIADSIDIDAARAAWEEDSIAPEWDGPLRWLHGDLHAQNILLSEGRLRAVIDFGCLGIGDPACELSAAWRLLPEHARQHFRTELSPDAATWRRARAWALSISMMEVQHYRSSNPVLASIAMKTIERVLADRGG